MTPRRWSPEQAVAYKKYLVARSGKRKGPLSNRTTLVTKPRSVQSIFRWLADQDGYRTRIRHTDVQFFNPMMHDKKLARTPQAKPAPTLDQVRHVILSLPRRWPKTDRNSVELANNGL